MSCRRDDHNGTVASNAPTAPPASSSGNFLDCELTVKAVSAELLLYEFFYNYQRPHSALDYLTPNEYVVA